jgi:L-ascorbate metabolism protein UlaG (beta-lactamase superfamily)
MIIILSFVGLILLLVTIGFAVGFSQNAPGYSGPVSDHFDGRTFSNREPVELADMGKGLRYLFKERRAPWDQQQEPPRFDPLLESVGSWQLRVYFINHATTLIQMDGVNILTDPIWSERASPFSWTGPRRYHEAGIPLAQLPAIDLVLITHNHYDHLDLPTLRTLAIEHNPLFVSGLGNGALLRAHGIDRIGELDWDDVLKHSPLTIIGQRCRHFSGRGFGDRQRTLWLSFLIQGAEGALYFAGDTAYGSHFAETGRQFGPIRLSILPIGAYEPRWFMGTLHMSPAEAVQAHKDLQAKTSLAIHFGTFRLSQESRNRPVEDLGFALRDQGVSKESFRVLTPGTGMDVPPI